MYQALRRYAAYLLIMLIFPLSVRALPEDCDQKLNIAANSSIFNYKTGMDTYEGNVKVRQGTTRLTADRLVTQKNNHHKIVSAVAIGINQLAEYTTEPKKGDPVLHAKAKIIKFYPITSIVILEQEVVVTQQENSFHGPLIIYNMKDQVVTAPASKNGRATIVIEPEQLKL
jgi:lipopolysaccharide export system protein LptA